jgi:cold shock CspA family protein/ribosome-associated translation inhibitor RaiA
MTRIKLDLAKPCSVASMKIEPEISYRNIEPSRHLQERIDKEIRQLEKIDPDLTSCTVLVEGPSGHKHAGGLASVRIHLTAPGRKDIAVTHVADDNHAHEDVLVSVRDAFKAAQRQIKKLKHDDRVDRTTDLTRVAGKIARFLAEEDAGFIVAEDGQECYFQARSVTDARFRDLKVGDDVTFRIEPGNKGPQAVAVHLRGD